MMAGRTVAGGRGRGRGRVVRSIIGRRQDVDHNVGQGNESGSVGGSGGEQEDVDDRAGKENNNGDPEDSVHSRPGETDGGGQGNDIDEGDGNGGGGRGGGRGGARGGARGGSRGGGSTRKRSKRTLIYEDNSTCAQWDDDGREILPIQVEADPRNHRTRGYSPGGFGTYPRTPVMVRISGNLIDCPKALRNILAITRVFWPGGCVGVKDIDRKDPEFWSRCITEFLHYYVWDPKFANEEEASASIRNHMRDNLRRTLRDDKRRADNMIKDNGGTYADHRPKYVKPDVWSRLCEYWVSDEFKKKSEAGKAARKKVKAPHTSGARSFDRRRRDYMDTHDGKLDYTIVYKDCHTLKDKERSGQWITEEAKQIIDRYIEICLAKGIDPKETNIHTWIEAVGGVRRNTILGHPRVRPSDVLGPESQSSRPRKGEGSSGRSSMTRIQDDMFLRVVDETLTRDRAHPEEYTLTPDEVQVLASNVIQGYADLPQDHPVMREIRNSIIRVAIEVLNNLYKTHGPEKAKGKAIVEDDDNTENNRGGDWSTDSEDPEIRPPPNVTSKGGPVIKG